MIKRYRVIIYLIFGIFLISGFLLRLKNSELEPYPAVLFPKGSGIVNVKENEVEFHQYLIGGLRLNKFRELDFSKIKNPDIARSISLASKYNFGLNSVVDTIIISESLNLKLIDRIRFSQKKEIETKNWLKKIIKEQGFKEEFIQIRSYHLSYNLKVRKVLDTLNTSIEEINIEND